MSYHGDHRKHYFYLVIKLTFFFTKKHGLYCLSSFVVIRHKRQWTLCGNETGLRGRPKNGQNFGWGKNSRLWAFFSAKKVHLTTEKVEIGPKLAKISGGVKPGHLEERGGPKMAKIHYGIPRVKDLQSAWLLLLHCASARANYQIRTVDPVSTGEFAQAHDDGVWQCVCNLLQIEPTQAASVRDIASLPLVLGGLGLRSVGRSGVPAHWASWADCIPMIFERHPMVAERLLRELEGHPTTPCLRAAVSAAQSLDGVLGWSPPSWTALANGERPESHPPEEFEPGTRRGGWQHEAASRTVQRFRDVELFARLDDTGQALLRSQGGPGAGLALTACPLCRVTSIEPQLFRVLLRRLHLPLPSTARHCRCGLPLDSRGHHRAACARLGSWGGEGIRWKTWLLGFVERLVGESPPTSLCETLISRN